MTAPDELAHCSRAALELARLAVEIDPRSSSFWNTLGVAQYRTQDFADAAESLNKSMDLDADEMRLAHNAFFLAMAHWGLGQKEDARRWYHTAIEWMQANNAPNKELLQFRAEAEHLMGLTPGD